jgi:GNAT superfamily N-acetyltransferase
MNIRRAAASDTEQIAVLCGQLGYPATAAEVSARFAKIAGLADHAVFVAEEDAQLLGWIHVHIAPSMLATARAELSALVVHSERRGTGVGKLLMSAAEQWAREHGCRTVRLRSNLSRAGAHAFYQRLGYHEAKTQKSFTKELS